MEDLNQPATKADVRASEERMQEFMRGLQTELLRGFASFVDGSNIRFQKLESDVSNVNAAATLRMANFEERLAKLELKIWGDRPRP